MTGGKPITIAVTGKPIAKGRGRAGKTADGRAVIFTPSSTRKWEADARQLARIEMGAKKPFDGPLQIIVRAIFTPPTSWPAWKREMALTGEIMHTTKPDGDNILKAMKDALNSVVYADDSQVVKSGIEKRYGPQPMVVATITPLAGIPAQVTRRPVD